MNTTHFQIHYRMDAWHLVDRNGVSWMEAATIEELLKEASEHFGVALTVVLTPTWF